MNPKSNKTAEDLKEKLTVKPEVKKEIPKAKVEAPKKVVAKEPAAKKEPHVLTDFEIMQELDILSEKIAARVAENKIKDKPWKIQSSWATRLKIMADRVRRYNRFDPRSR